MKKSSLVIVVAVITSIVMMGCKNLVSEASFSVEELDLTPETVAKNYVQNMTMQCNIANSRTAADTSSYPEYIYDIEIEDEDGNKVLFEELSEEIQADLYKSWQEDFIVEIIEKLENDPSLLEAIAIENRAFKDSLEETERSVISVSPDKFVKKYYSRLKKYLSVAAKESARGSLKTLINADEAILNKDSVEIFMNNYKKGRILINTSTDWSFLFLSKEIPLYIGHASMMYADEFADSWKTDPSAKATVTSYPLSNTKGRTWADQTDGVQYEPLGYWCSSEVSDTVTILDVQSYKWVLFKGSVYKDATTAEHSSAADYAIKQITKPYNYNWLAFGMWNTDKFYCSSLVFRAWYEVSTKYSLNTNVIWVSPGELVLSKRSKEIASYKN